MGEIIRTANSVMSMISEELRSTNDELGSNNPQGNSSNLSATSGFPVVSDNATVARSRASLPTTKAVSLITTERGRIMQIHKSLSQTDSTSALKS